MVAVQDPGHACFLDELFMALLGHQGDVFISDDLPTHVPGSVPRPSDCTFKTADTLFFISESDRLYRIIVDGLLKLGFHCQALQQFVDREEFSWAEKGCSHYRCALSHGVAELLEVYSSAVLKLQIKLDDDQPASLASIRYFLAEFLVVFPEIHAVVYQVQMSSLRGAQVLRLLQEKEMTGAVEVQSCIHRLSWHCYQIFSKHLTAWIEFGEMVDKSGEFMVQESGWDEGLREHASAGAAPAREWHHRFHVVEDFIPPEISAATAANILFIGKAVRALESKPGELDGWKQEVFELIAQFKTDQTFNASLFENSVEVLTEQAAGRLWELVKTEGDLKTHLRALRDYFLMGKGDFWQDFLVESHALMSLPAIQATAQTNILVPFQQSASMTSAEADPLFPQIALVYPSPSGQDPAGSSTTTGLLATSQSRGHNTETPYMSVGTDAARTIRNAPETSSTQFFSARQSVDALPTAPTKRTDASNASGSTSLGNRAAGGKKGMKVPDYDASWDPLTLDYHVNWPLHLLLSPEVMTKYTRMFQYLFRLERMQLELKRCWTSMSEQTRQTGRGKAALSSLAVPAGMPSLWQVRTHMAHVISNLQLYIQVDVIQVQYEEMCEKLREVTTLKAAEEAHENFLSTCITQSCLDVPMFSSLLSKTLALCRTFCSLNQDSHKRLKEYPVELVEAFQRNSRLFFRLLSTPAMQSRARAPYLRLLLLRLNFNDFLQQDTEKYNLSHV